MAGSGSELPEHLLSVGAVAPPFALMDSGGVSIRVPGESGHWTFVAFLPMAFTPVCGRELHDFAEFADHSREQWGGLLDVVGVSCDSVAVLARWSEDFGAHAATLLSDFWPHGQVARGFGAFTEETGVPQRASFLLDDRGTVRWSMCSPPGVARDPATYRAAVAQHLDAVRQDGL